MPAEAWQALLSLVAVGLLVALVRWLRLGSEEGADADAARRAAASLVHDFEPVDVVWDPQARAGLAQSRDGRVMLVKLHGAHWAGRPLHAPSAAIDADGALRVDPGDRQFGAVRLRLPDAQRWKAAINRL